MYPVTNVYLIALPQQSPSRVHERIRSNYACDNIMYKVATQQEINEIGQVGIRLKETNIERLITLPGNWEKDIGEHLAIQLANTQIETICQLTENSYDHLSQCIELSIKDTRTTGFLLHKNHINKYIQDLSKILQRNIPINKRLYELTYVKDYIIVSTYNDSEWQLEVFTTI